MTPRLTTALRAARAAGKVLHQKFHETRTIKSKGKRDIVTDADFAADRTVREILLGRFTDDRFLSEEGDAAARAALWAEAKENPALAVWVVDPLDGTTNYARHLPIFCVSIALYQNHAVQLGAIYDPIHHELYAAERGHGATLNGKPIVVRPTASLQDAVFGMEWAALKRSAAGRPRSWDAWPRG